MNEMKSSFLSLRNSDGSIFIHEISNLPTIKSMQTEFETTDMPNVTEQLVTVFPNPSTGKFIVSIPQEMQGTIKLYNLMGLEILSEELQSNKMDYTFDLSTYSNGVYLVNVVTPQGIMNKRIILDRLSID